MAGSRGSTNDGSHGLLSVSSTHSSTGMSVTRRFPRRDATAAGDPMYTVDCTRSRSERGSAAVSGILTSAPSPAAARRARFACSGTDSSPRPGSARRARDVFERPFTSLVNVNLRNSGRSLCSSDN